MGGPHGKTTSAARECCRPWYWNGYQRWDRERSECVRRGGDSQLQGGHPSAFELALLLVPRTRRRRVRKKRSGFDELCRRDERYEIRSHDCSPRTGKQQFDAVAGLEGIPGLAHAAQQEAIIEL